MTASVTLWCFLKSFGYTLVLSECSTMTSLLMFCMEECSLFVVYLFKGNFGLKMKSIKLTILGFHF